MQLRRRHRPLALAAWADAPPEPCASCPVRAVCRGGCRVVARHLTSSLGPDPECRGWSRGAS
ncbi:MAG: SPASM domain-containing protein [Polyangiales bacterium]